MAIPASHIVKVSSRVISGGSADLETNGLLLTSDTGNKLQTIIAKTFVSADEVAKFFGDSADEAKFALQYFKGVENQQKAPTALVVGRYSKSDSAFLADMRKICNITRNWVGFTTLEKPTFEIASKMGEFADQEEDYVAVVWNDDANALDSSQASGTTLYKLNGVYNCLASVFGDYKDAAFVLANGASIAWTRRQGVKTWFAKSSSGLTPRINNEGDANMLEKIRANYYGQFATRNAEFKFFNQGTLTSTRYGFIDVLYCSIWLRNAIQRACMDGFKGVNRTPYNDQGKALMQAWVGDPIDTAKLSGIIDTGLELSRAQRAQILQETGDEEVASALFTKGYWVGITFPPANGRANREPPIISLYWTYAGSVQRLNVEATVIN